MIQIKKIHPDAVIPEYKTEGSVGFDFHTIEEQLFPPRKVVLSRTGLSIATPETFMLMVTPRSSTFKRYGLLLSNSVGIIDNDYCGDEDEILLSFYNPTPASVAVHKGTRLGQGIFVRVLAPFNFPGWEESDVMGASRGGYGSTGR